MNLLKSAILLSFLYPAIALAGDLTSSKYAELESRLLRSKEVTTPSVHLTERYKSMRGPKSIRSFQLEANPGNEKVWIRHYKVDVLDAQAANIEDSKEFLCHAWLMADTGVRSPESGKRGVRGGRDPGLFLTISQGFEDTQFPDGYAVAYNSFDIRRVGLMTMAVNNNHDEIDKEIQFRATIDYLDDQAAKQLGVKPLFGFQLHAHPSLSEVMPASHSSGKVHLSESSDSEHQSHAEHQGHGEKADVGDDGSGGHSMHGVPRSGTVDHWLVPPGRQVLRTDVEQGVIEHNGLIHFIKIHLHPYGESVALVDKATGDVIWKGSAVNNPKRAHVVSIDSYSSSVGIPVFKDREYELVTIYNNPTDLTIDAMAVMRIFIERITDSPTS